MIKPTETTEATVYETAETDETVERIQSARGIEIDDRSGQLHAELAAKDSDQVAGRASIRDTRYKRIDIRDVRRI